MAVAIVSLAMGAVTAAAAWWLNAVLRGLDNPGLPKGLRIALWVVAAVLLLFFLTGALFSSSG